MNASIGAPLVMPPLAEHKLFLPERDRKENAPDPFRFLEQVDDRSSLLTSFSSSY
jgi:hypothetical protein